MVRNLFELYTKYRFTLGRNCSVVTSSLVYRNSQKNWFSLQNSLMPTCTGKQLPIYHGSYLGRSNVFRPFIYLNSNDVIWWRHTFKMYFLFKICVYSNTDFYEFWQLTRHLSLMFEESNIFTKMSYLRKVTSFAYLSTKFCGI